MTLCEDCPFQLTIVVGRSMHLESPRMGSWYFRYIAQYACMALKISLSPAYDGCSTRFDKMACMDGGFVRW